MLSNLSRAGLANIIPANFEKDPFESTIAIGDFDFDGPWWIVYLIVVVFDYIFSILLEYLFYRLRYKKMPWRSVFRATVIANTISYIALVAGVILWMNIPRLFSF